MVYLPTGKYTIHGASGISFPTFDFARRTSELATPLLAVPGRSIFEDFKQPQTDPTVEGLEIIGKHVSSNDLEISGNTR